jgi:hypothetical protein
MLLGMRLRLLAIAALLVLAAVVARGESALPVGESRPWFNWWRLPTLTTPGISAGGGQASSEPGLWLAILGWVAMLLPVALLAVVILAAMVIGIRQFRRIGPPTPVQRDEEPGHPGTDLATPWLRAARAAQDALNANRGGPPSDAVIAAWLELEQVAAGSGHSRRAHQTPTEFTNALDVDTEAVDTLRALYQKARFGPPGMVGKPEAEQAKAALDDIVGRLETVSR